LEVGIQYPIMITKNKGPGTYGSEMMTEKN